MPKTRKSFWQSLIPSKAESGSSVSAAPKAVSDQDGALPQATLSADLDFKVFRDNDVSIRIWWPERIETVIREIVDLQSISKSAFVRDALFQHVYGEHAWLSMRERREGFFYVAPEIRSAGTPMFSRSSNHFPSLGKSTRVLKLHLPARLRNDLQVLADAAGQRLSNYIRLQMIPLLLGRRFVLEFAVPSPNPEDESDSED